MRATDRIQLKSTWTLRVIGWLVALLIIFSLGYKVMFQKQAARKDACLDQVSSAQAVASTVLRWWDGSAFPIPTSTTGEKS